MNLTPEQRERYRNPKGKRCDCGNPAFRMVSSVPVCERCNRIELEHFSSLKNEHIVRNSRQYLALDFRAERFWDGLVEGFQKPRGTIGWGSLELLERKLAA